MKKLSKALKKYQTDHKYTYEEMAKFLNLSKSTLYSYENELRNPTWKTLEMIAKKININTLSLIDDNSYEADIKLLDILKKDPIVYEFMIKNPKTVLQKIKKMIPEK